MNLFKLLTHIAPTPLEDAEIPTNLFGAFRRKSITFFNGLTDEHTLVYWFQSKSFTIDLRLKDMRNTPILERQGWIGKTLWDTQQQLLSWQVDASASYQNHNQWPEPAKLHAIGNCFLEFSPSNVYVEDWRQQATQGLFLGLRLRSATHIESGNTFAMDGGLIICGSHIAYAQSRFPDIQQQILKHDTLQAAIDAGMSLAQINSYEVSIGHDGIHKHLSTQNHQLLQKFDFENFDLLNPNQLQQHKVILGEQYLLTFDIDAYQASYVFQIETDTHEESQAWLKQEQSHLMHHAKVIY